MTLPGTLHPPSGDDDAADAGLRHLRHVRLPPAAGGGDPARRFPDHRRLGRSCRAPARRRWRPRSRRRSSGSSRPSPALDSMTSTSGQGVTTITMQFDLDRNIDGAALDVQSAITTAARKLPVEMTTPPSFQKVNPADQPVLFIVAHLGHAAALGGRRICRDADGAAHLDASGRRAGAGVRRAEIRRARPGRTPTRWPRGHQLDDVQNAVAAANSNTPVGTLSGTDAELHAAGRRPARRRRAVPQAARSSPIATARRCGSATSRPSSTASRTTRSPAGSTARRGDPCSPV